VGGNLLPLPLAGGTGFPGVRGRVFVIWGGGGEHHHGTCNSHPSGYSFGESIPYNAQTKAKKRQERSVPRMWCNCRFIKNTRLEENISAPYD